MSAELAARRTAAEAVLADFRSEHDRFLADPVHLRAPDYPVWIMRLARHLRYVLDELGDEAAAAREPRAAPELAIDLAEEVTEERAAEIREALDRGVAVQQLAEVRALLEAFDWETGDRQYALEHIDDIVNGRSR